MALVPRARLAVAPIEARRASPRVRDWVTIRRVPRSSLDIRRSAAPARTRLTHPLPMHGRWGRACWLEATFGLPARHHARLPIPPSPAPCRGRPCATVPPARRARQHPGSPDAYGIVLAGDGLWTTRHGQAAMFVSEPAWTPCSCSCRPPRRAYRCGRSRTGNPMCIAAPVLCSRSRGDDACARDSRMAIWGLGAGDPGKDLPHVSHPRVPIIVPNLFRHCATGYSHVMGARRRPGQHSRV